MKIVVDSVCVLVVEARKTDTRFMCHGFLSRLPSCYVETDMVVSPAPGDMSTTPVAIISYDPGAINPPLTPLLNP